MTRKLQFSSCSQEGNEENTLYCYHRMPEEPDHPMIACDAPDCPNKWIHFSCVGISEKVEEGIQQELYISSLVDLSFFLHEF